MCYLEHIKRLILEELTIRCDNTLLQNRILVFKTILHEVINALYEIDIKTHIHRGGDTDDGTKKAQP